MIIEMLLTAIYNVISLLTTPIDIPPLSEDVLSMLDTVFGYLQNGVQIINNFVSLDYLFSLFMILIVIDIAIGIYHFVMWILRKIPMISVS